MKYLFILLFTMLTLKLTAQQIKPAPDYGYAVIKGHIKNTGNTFWEYMTANYLGYKNVAITVDEHGNFLKRIKLEGPYTDILFDLNRGVLLYLQKNDTITVNWDAQNIAETLTVKANNYDNDIQTAIALFKLHLSSIDELQKALYNTTTPDSVKFSKVNQYYNKAIELVLSGNCTEAGAVKLGLDAYFRSASMLFDHGLLKKYALFLNHPFKSWDVNYQTESEEYFEISSDYRNFIYDYVRLDLLFTKSGPTNDRSRVVHTIALNTAYAGFMAFKMYEIRDWYLTKCIIDNFKNFSFDEATEVYNKFISEIKTPYYADTLKKFYANIQRLKPGTPAPGFVLRDEKGKAVSLAQFKGKAVYIDFWGVNCGPCINAIKDKVPALHEKYKDKGIVFINICVDVNESIWKANLKSLNLHGVNLIAEGWTKNPVCKAYGIEGIPHYSLIDANGNIVDSNATGPDHSHELYEKLDKLLQ
jgi:peroxiredoxin